MEPFRLDRQAKGFLAVIVFVAIAMVPLAPFILLAFGAVSLLVLVFVWAKSVIRNRRLLGPLSQAEGAVALSTTALAVGGVLVVGYMSVVIGTGNALSLANAMLPFSAGPKAPRPVGTSGTWYSDPAMRLQLKDELAKAGIPFTVSEQDGKEFVNWSQEHNAAVEAIREKIRSGPRSGGSVHFAKPETKTEFAEWLARKGVRSETITRAGARGEAKCS
jgi:heme exporter protein D